MKNNLFFYREGCEESDRRPKNVPAPFKLPDINLEAKDDTILLSEYFFNSLGYSLFVS